MSVIAAGIAGGVALGSAIYGGVSASKMNKRAERFQREENNKARDYNDKLIRQQNDYNSPLRQMERLKAAGVNPHLAYQNGSPMNTQQTTPTASTNSSSPNYKIADMSGPSQGLMNAVMMKSQIDNLNADTEKKRAEARNTDTAASIGSVELSNKVTQLNQENLIRDVQIKGGLATRNLTDEQVKRTQQEVVNMITGNAKVEAEIDKIASEKALTDQQKTNLVANLGVIVATKRNLDAETKLKGTQAELNKEKTKTEAVSRSNIRIDTLQKNEMLKQMERSNRVGEKYDFTNAESNMIQLDANAKRAIKLVVTADKDNEMLGKKLTEQDYINSIRHLQTVDQTFETFNPFNKFKRGSSISTTTRFDNQGDYSGHSTTRTRSR